MENKDTEKKETDDSTPRRRRKAGLKFAPKVLPKKPPKIIPKTEPQEENKALTVDKKLMSKLGSLQSTYAPGSGTKAEKQGTPVQVAFGQADPSVPRTFPTLRGSSSDLQVGQTGIGSRSDRSRRRRPARDQRTPAREGPRRGRRTLVCPRLGRPARTSSDIVAMKEEQHCRVGREGKKDKSKDKTIKGVSAVKLPKEHDEPWDYTCTDYPVSLPLRRSYYGDAEILDEEESRHSSGRAQDGELSAAEKLGLRERVDTPQLLFFQFPTTLPLPRQADPVAETEADTNLNVNAKSMGDNRKRRLDSIHGCGLKELPGGLMGKMLVYKSGKVKMTLGDMLFDVSSGSSCMFAQEVAAINTREKHCCGLGEVGKRAIVTPDIDSLLGSIEKMY